jgi:hypothetical protein
LYGEAKNFHYRLQEDVAGIANSIGAEQKLRPGGEPKDKAGAFKKISRKGYLGPGGLTDVAATMIVVDTPAQMDQAVEKLRAQYGTVAAPGLQTTPLGYLDQKVLVQDPQTGVIGEVILIPRPFYSAREVQGGHDLYDMVEKADDNTTSAVMLANQVAEISRTMYAEAAKDAAKEWGPYLPSSAANAATSSREAVPSISSLISSLNDTGTQVAPRSLDTAAMEPLPTLSAMNAGRPSQLYNKTAGADVASPGTGRLSSSVPGIGSSMDTSTVSTSVTNPTLSGLMDAMRASQPLAVASHEVTKGWRVAPKLRIVDTAAGIPMNRQDLLTAPRETKAAVTGDGTVYLVRGNIHSMDDLVLALSHEHIGHLGVRLVLGDAYDGFLDRMWRNADKLDQALLGKLGRAYAWADPKTLEGRRELMDEYIAHLAQTNPKAGMVQTLVAAVRRWLAKYFPKMRVTDADIVALIAKAREHVTGTNEAVGGRTQPADLLPATRMRVEDQAVPGVNRNQSGEFRRNAKGDITGAPPGVKSEADVQALVDRTLAALNSELAQGPDSFEWYERSGKAIREITHGDQALMEKTVRLAALLSANTSLGGNTTAFIKAAYQLARGETPAAGRFPNSFAKSAEAALSAKDFTDVRGADYKVQSFYQNLHDATFGDDRFTGSSTQDMWMASHFGYPENANGEFKLTQAQYRFAHMVTQEVTDAYNAEHGTSYLPRHVQAALWTYERNKAKGGVQGPVQDFSTYISRATQHVTAEVLPGPGTTEFEALSALPREQKEALTREALKIVQDENGNDKILGFLKVPLYSQRQEAGAYEGAVTPNVITSVVAEGGVDASRAAADAYALAWMQVFRQQAVPWLRLSPKVTGGVDTAVITFENEITPEQQDAIDKLLEPMVKTGFTFSGNSIIVANFAGMKKAAFLKAVNAAFDGASIPGDNVIVSLHTTKAEGAYHDVKEITGHDWSNEQAANEALDRATAATRPPGLTEWIHSAQADARQLFAKYAEKGKVTRLLNEPKQGSNLANLQKANELTRAGNERIEQERRGVITWKETAAMARALGTTKEEVAKFIERKTGTAFNAEQLQQAANMVSRRESAMQKHFEGLKEKIDNGTITDEDLAQAQEMLMDAVDLNAQFMGVRAEAGRALNLFKKLKATSKRAEAYRNIISQGGGRKQMLVKVAALADATEAGQVNKLARKFAEATTMTKIVYAWRAGLLTGIQTHIVNIISNASVAAFEDASTGLASVYGKFHGGEKVTMQEAGARFAANLAGSLNGLAAAGRIIKTGEEIGQWSRGEDPTHGNPFRNAQGELTGLNKLAIAPEMVYRALGGMDAFFRTVEMSKQIEMWVMDKHLKTGESIESLRQNVPDEVIERAQKWADRQTFQDAPGQMTADVLAFLRRHPVLKFIFPFVNTPVNLTKYALRVTFPTGLLFEEVRNDLMAGGKARDMALARMTLGTSIMAAGYMLAAAGVVTGGAPEDKNEREWFYAQKKLPYAWKINGRHYTYNRFDPLMLPFGIAADAYRMREKLGEKEASKLMMIGWRSLLENLANKTYLSGMSQFVQMLNEPERYGEQWFRSLAGSFVPTIFAHIAQANDKYIRRADSIMDQVQKRIPGKADDLPPKLDVKGQPVEKDPGTGFWFKMLSPVRVSAKGTDPVAEELARLGTFPGMPSRVLSKAKQKIRLTAEEHNQLIAAQQPQTYIDLYQLIRSERYQRMGDDEKIIAIGRVAGTGSRRTAVLREQLKLKHLEK